MMTRFGSGRDAFGIVVAISIVAACGGSATASRTVPAFARPARVQSGPPGCTGQRTTKKYGNVTAKLQTAGGSLCIPAFAGFGGSIEYPGVERSVKLTIRTSAQNVYNEPQLGSGTSMVYVNLH